MKEGARVPSNMPRRHAIYLHETHSHDAHHVHGGDRSPQALYDVNAHPAHVN